VVAADTAASSRPSTPASATRLNSLERDLGVFKNVLAASESRATALQHSLEAAEKELDDKEVELSRLEGELAASHAKERELEYTIETVTAKAAQSASAAADLQDRLDELKAGPAASSRSGDGADAAALAEELADVRRDLARTHGEAQQAVQARTLIEADLVKVKAKVDALEEQLHDKTAELASAQGASHLARSRFSCSCSLTPLGPAGRATTLEQQLSTSHADVERLTSAHAALESTKSDLTTSLDELRTQLSDLTSSSSSSTEQTLALTTSLSQLQSSESALRAELDSLRADVADAERTKREVEDELALCRGEVEETSATLSAAMAELDATKDEVTELERAVEEGRDNLSSEGVAKAKLEADTARLEDEVKALQARVAEASESSTALKAELTALRASLEDKEAVVARLEADAAKHADAAEADERESNQVEALRQELELEREQLGEVNRSLHELRALYAEAQDEVDALRSTSPGARSPAQPPPPPDVDDLRLQLSDAQARIRQLEQDIFTLESTRVKMLKANGDLKSQVESMMEALDEERTKARAKELDLAALRARPARSPSRADPSTPPSAANVPLPATPTRTPSRSHAHRRTASILPSIDELYDPTGSTAASNGRPPSSLAPLISPPLVPVGRQHVRQASLSLLKARMEDEYGVPDLDAAGPLVSPGAAAGAGRGGGAGPGARAKVVRAPLTHDLVWCHCCAGDLLVV